MSEWRIPQSWFDSLDKAQERAKRAGDAARMMADDGVTPEAGGAYTVSPDFQCGDRSYCKNILRVMAVNDGHALVQIAHGERWKKEPFVLTVDDRAWYPADNFMEALPAPPEDTA